MMRAPLRQLFAVVATATLLSGCGETRLAAQAQLPPPLIDQQPARIGIHYSQEFREFVHKESRGQMEYAVTLGPAHVTNLDWLLKAMFKEVVPVDDPTRIADIKPPLVLVLEPKFEEYSFLGPKDVAGEAFIVTIRYLLTLYDGSGARVDSFTYTGYGREKAGSLAGKEPLAIATQRAMRDAGAKVAVELVEQDSVRLLLKNPVVPGLLPPPPAGPATPAGEAPAQENPPAQIPVSAPAPEPPPAEAPASEPPPESPSLSAPGA